MSTEFQRRETPERITYLDPKQVRVIGGAMRGRIGLHGSVYTLPTRNARMVQMPLPEVKNQVDLLLSIAARHPDKVFVVDNDLLQKTEYGAAQVAPMFASAGENVALPKPFIDVLNQETP